MDTTYISPVPGVAAVPRGYHHEAVLYRGHDDFLDGTLQFVRDGFEAGEPTLVVVSRAKIRALRDELAGDGERLYFADMDTVGRNPACIIPAWTRFVDEHRASGTRLRGVGEPVWPERSGAELSECQLHERLLNIAFDPATPFWLRCPYDADHLDDDVLAHARDAHDLVYRDGVAEPGNSHAGAAEISLDDPLPAPTAPVVTHHFATDDEIAALRELVAGRALAAGLPEITVTDLVLAVHEVATNSIRYGGGAGEARMWRDGATLVCEVRDGGHITDPLVGRRAPRADAVGGRGIWIANHLADLVQVRSSPAGTVVRVHVRTPGPESQGTADAAHR
ncbi:MAG TPA: sensor histidine kinase [Acidimicrobiia bacterium]|nr:sensor histidine kinase [Acidimicrobiia bacterium]